jgi:hypothetical protein
MSDAPQAGVAAEQKPAKERRKLVRAARVAPKEGWATKAEIARLMDMPAQSLRNYLAKPDAPKPNDDLHYNIEECRNFIDASLSAWGTVGAEMAEFRAAKMKVEVATKEFDLQVKKGQFIAKEDVGRTLIPLVQEIDDLIRQEYELILPAKYVGKNAIECAQLNAEARDRIARRFKTGSLAAEAALVESAKAAV